MDAHVHRILGRFSRTDVFEAFHLIRSWDANLLQSARSSRSRRVLRRGLILAMWMLKKLASTSDARGPPQRTCDWRRRMAHFPTTNSRSLPTHSAGSNIWTSTRRGGRDHYVNFTDYFSHLFSNTGTYSAAPMIHFPTLCLQPHSSTETFLRCVGCVRIPFTRFLPLFYLIRAHQ